MRTNPDPNEELARIFWEIHAHILVPFYKSKRSRRDPEDRWEALPEKALDKTKVDKQFFRAMAAYALRALER